MRLLRNKWPRLSGEKRLATYPACDHLNVALGYLLENADENRRPIEEICYAITKSGGYFYTHIASLLSVTGFGYFVNKANVAEV